MSRVGVQILAAGILLAVGLVWVKGGPEQAGALAGLSGSGAGAAAGLLWIMLVPAAGVLVPALLLTAAAEALHGIWVARHPRQAGPGLGSRSGPGDT